MTDIICSSQRPLRSPKFSKIPILCCIDLLIYISSSKQKSMKFVFLGYKIQIKYLDDDLRGVVLKARNVSSFESFAS